MYEKHQKLQSSAHAELDYYLAVAKLQMGLSIWWKNVKNK